MCSSISLERQPKNKYINIYFGCREDWLGVSLNPSSLQQQPAEAAAAASKGGSSGCNSSGSSSISNNKSSSTWQSSSSSSSCPLFDIFLFSSLHCTVCFFLAEGVFGARWDKRAAAADAATAAAAASLHFALRLQLE